MDSGNSGSLQSSSCGDDEFDSRCGGGEDSSSPLSALLRSPSVLPTGSFYGIQDLAAPPQLSHAAHWPSSSTPLPAGGFSPACAQAPPAAVPPPRGSRKRTRASRRAPTTVLTTDTSNFRAMVQEFTGVPAPPFAAAGTRSRFDHRLPSSRPAAAPSPYLLLRPFAQRLQHNQAAPYHPPVVAAPPPATNKAVAGSAAPSTAAGDGYRLASGALGMQGHGSGGNYTSFQSPPVGNNGSRYPAAHHMFDVAAQRLPDSAGISDLAQGQMNPAGTHLHRPPCDRGHGSDELSGLVDGAASVSGCKAMTTYSSGAGAAPHLPAARNAESTTITPTVRARGVVDSSWICTSD